jgi:hypothetical protein
MMAKDEPMIEVMRARVQAAAGCGLHAALR